MVIFTKIKTAKSTVKYFIKIIVILVPKSKKLFLDDDAMKMFVAKFITPRYQTNDLIRTY